MKVHSTDRLCWTRNYIDPRHLQNRAPASSRVLEFPAQAVENPLAYAGEEGEALVRPAFLAAVTVLLAACSSSAPPPPSDPTASAAILKKDCSDPKWREENLGLWYSVCRQPLRW
jgi:hypothetical protein